MLTSLVSILSLYHTEQLMKPFSQESTLAPPTLQTHTTTTSHTHLPHKPHPLPSHMGSCVIQSTAGCHLHPTSMILITQLIQDTHPMGVAYSRGITPYRNNTTKVAREPRPLRW